MPEFNTADSLIQGLGHSGVTVPVLKLVRFFRFFWVKPTFLVFPVFFVTCDNTAIWVVSFPVSFPHKSYPRVAFLHITFGHKLPAGGSVTRTSAPVRPWRCSRRGGQRGSEWVSVTEVHVDLSDAAAGEEGSGGVSEWVSLRYMWTLDPSACRCRSTEYFGSADFSGSLVDEHLRTQTDADPVPWWVLFSYKL